MSKNDGLGFVGVCLESPFQEPSLEAGELELHASVACAGSPCTNPISRVIGELANGDRRVMG